MKRFTETGLMQTVGKSPSSAAVLANGVLGPWYETTSEDPPSVAAKPRPH